MQTHLSHDTLLAGLAKSPKRKLVPWICRSCARPPLDGASVPGRSRSVLARSERALAPATALATRKHVQIVNRDFYSSYATTIFHCFSVNNSCIFKMQGLPFLPGNTFRDPTVSKLISFIQMIFIDADSVTGSRNAILAEPATSS